jgi:hypothetical protein
MVVLQLAEGYLTCSSLSIMEPTYSEAMFYVCLKFDLLCIYLDRYSVEDSEINLIWKAITDNPSNVLYHVVCSFQLLMLKRLNECGFMIMNYRLEKNCICKIVNWKNNLYSKISFLIRNNVRHIPLFVGNTEPNIEYALAFPRATALVIIIIPISIVVEFFYIVDI